MSGKTSVVTVTIGQLASAVRASDLYSGVQSREQIAHILELALKNSIGLCALNCLVNVDLGNGHLLVCTTQRKPSSEATNPAPEKQA